MELLAINTADLLLPVFSPYICHRADQRMADTLRRDQLLKLTTEARVRGQIMEERKEALHIDLCTDRNMLVPRRLAAVITVLAGALAQHSFSLHAQLLDQLFADKAIHKRIGIAQVAVASLCIIQHYGPSCFKPQGSAPA